MPRYPVYRAQSPGTSRNRQRRTPRGLVAVFLACALAVAPLAASAAEGEGPTPAQVWADRLTVVKPEAPFKMPAGVLHGTSSSSASEAAPLAAAALDEVYDLRKEGLSTSVKCQGFFNTCWAFGDVAAFESGLLKQRGGDPDDVDLSELQLATFVDWVATEEEAAALGAPGQAGEGVQLEGCLPIDFGGNSLITLGVLARGTGFVDEAAAPYRNKEGLLYSEKMPGWDGEEHDYSLWDSDGDWSVDRSLATKQTYQLQAMGGGYVEPVAAAELAQFADYAAANPGAYVADPSYIDVMKTAMMEHGVLAFAYRAASATFGEETVNLDEYTNEKRGAIFVDKPLESDHVVAAVGWDDTFKKEYFAEGHQPPADGAWIVKNSWGSDPGAEGNVCYWGIDGTGYFYLSYYDATISDYSWFDPVDKASETSLMLQHDLLGLAQGGCQVVALDEPIASANVFVAQEDMELSATTAFIESEESEITSEVYLLAPDWSDPTDGTLAAQKTHRAAGETFLRIELDEPVKIAAGQPFSIVQTQWSAASGEKTWYAMVEMGVTFARNGGDEQEPTSRATAVANPGESYLYDEQGWYDVCDVYSEPDMLDGQSDDEVTYGNVMIKALGNPAQLAEGEGVYVAPAEPGGDTGAGNGNAGAGAGSGSGDASAGDGSGNTGAGDANAGASDGDEGAGENLPSNEGDGSANEGSNPGEGAGSNGNGTAGNGSGSQDSPDGSGDAQDSAGKSAQSGKSESSSAGKTALAQTGDGAWPIVVSSLMLVVSAALVAAVSRSRCAACDDARSRGRHA